MGFELRKARVQEEARLSTSLFEVIEYHTDTGEAPASLLRRLSKV